MLESPDDLSSNPVASIVDDWVLYHGTSELYSASIESVGLGHHGGTPPYWADVQSFISYWEDFGPQSRAFASLAAFSRDTDSIRPVSFAVTFLRAARYAVHEPGGETLRLFRDSIEQISEELQDIDRAAQRLHKERARLLRLATRAGFESEAAFDAAQNGMRGFSSIDRALEVLREPDLPLEELERSRARYASSREEHAPVVYVVRLREADASQIRRGSGGGGFEINYRGVVPPARLLARVAIAPGRVVPRVHVDDPDSDESRSFREAVAVWGNRLAQ